MRSEIRTIGLIVKRLEHRARPVIEKLLEWSRERAIEILTDPRDVAAASGAKPSCTRKQNAGTSRAGRRWTRPSSSAPCARTSVSDLPGFRCRP